MINDQISGNSNIIQISLHSVQINNLALVTLFKGMSQNHSIKKVKIFDINLSNKEVFNHLKIWLNNLTSI